MSVEGIDPWISNFEETGTLAIQDSVGGLWFVLNNPSNAVAGPDLRVLLAQITTNGTLTGSLLIQFFQQGDGPNAAIKKFININEACMLPSNEGCEYAQEGYDCSGGCLNDSDGDGVCDEFEIAGCLDETACNFSPDATDDGGGCTYPEGIFDCDGNCLNDADGDGVCDSLEVLGCDQENACNYDSEATENDGSCVFAQNGLDCNGDCLNDADQDGVCDENEAFGCVDGLACNYDASATEDDGSCIYAASFYDCAGTCVNDTDTDGICDGVTVSTEAETSITLLTDTLDVPRNLIVDSSDDTEVDGVVTITGADEYGEVMVEEITANGTTAVAGKKAFKTTLRSRRFLCPIKGNRNLCFSGVSLGFLVGASGGTATCSTDFGASSGALSRSNRVRIGPRRASSGTDEQEPILWISWNKLSSQITTYTI
jgi:hypothetical protein